MRIYPPHPSVQAVSIDQVRDFGMIGNGTFRQCFQQMKNVVAVVHLAAGQLTDHDWMAWDLVILKQRSEAFVFQSSSNLST
jgi:hypothetical protein